MRTSTRHPRVAAFAALALSLTLARAVCATVATPPAPAGVPSPPAMRTLDVSSLGQAAPTDQRPGKAASLSVSPYT